MTSETLYAFLYGWVSPIVAPVSVIRGEQNAPAPSMSYITIMDGIFLPVGHPDHQLDDPTKLNARKWETQVTLSMIEVGAGNENLIKIIQNIDHQATLDYFAPRGISILNTPIIRPVPSLSNDVWVKEFNAEFQFLISNAVSGDATAFIETVELNNQIGG